uniref:RING-type domain-containing protein n=1 Tax=Craspedostauros australis TaxID=1486917 RepID=A0A7R9WMR3_9STRA|mmetsp:Transcript_12135/g.33388  ORF Transcript_12135/g.33388 Transcript_12135/m.33388 type:complete len:434 (+) Transcript_12135:213-1514(+)
MDVPVALSLNRHTSGQSGDNTKTVILTRFSHLLYILGKCTSQVNAKPVSQEKNRKQKKGWTLFQPVGIAKEMTPIHPTMLRGAARHEQSTTDAFAPADETRSYLDSNISPGQQHQQSRRLGAKDQAGDILAMLGMGLLVAFFFALMMWFWFKVDEWCGETCSRSRLRQRRRRAEIRRRNEEWRRRMALPSNDGTNAQTDGPSSGRPVFPEMTVAERTSVLRFFFTKRACLYQAMQQQALVDGMQKQASPIEHRRTSSRKVRFALPVDDSDDDEDDDDAEVIGDVSKMDSTGADTEKASGNAVDKSVDELPTHSPAPLKSKTAADTSGDHQSGNNSEVSTWSLTDNDRAPRINTKKKFNNSGGAASNAACCSICLMEYGPRDHVITGTSCTHLFHLDCALEWMKHGAMECPNCRCILIQPTELEVARIDRKHRS